MPRARGTAVVIAVLAAVLAIAALVLQSALALPAGQAGSAGRSPLTARGGSDGPGRPSDRDTVAMGGPSSWLRTVGGPQLASRGIVVHYPARGQRLLPSVPASAYVVADANTGQVLAAKDPHGDFPPASTLKVLTAITLIPLLPPDARVVATRQATSVQPNVVGLVQGQRYQVSSLFKALLLISANDAAVALAQAAGSYHRAITLMNAEAHWLQAYDVVAKDPNGLPAAHQHVSAYDEALIARRALAMPAFIKYDSALTARFRLKRRHWVTLVNQNTLLMTYRGGIGGKIGWTERAGATYIGMASRHGVTLIVTILHASPLTEITSGENLLNWGFAMDRKVRPVGILVPPLPGGPPGQ